MFYILLVLYLFLLHRNTQQYVQSLADYLLNLFVWMVASVIPTGYLLSAFSQLNNPLAWGSVLVVFALLQAIIIRKWADKSSFFLLNGITESFSAIGNTFKQTSILEKIIFIVLFIGVATTTLINGYVLITAYPNEWDSMTGHLVKCAYYLQNGNMNRLQGTTWTVDFYPNSLPTLQLFFYHVFGEKGFKVIHYVAYWVFVISSYKVTLQLFKQCKIALFIGLLAALLPTALIQATMTETDLVFSAYLGCIVYFLLSFALKPTPWNATLAALMMGIWMSHKVTFILVLPPVFLLVVLIIWHTKAFLTLKNRVLIVAVALISISIYVIPNGYIANVKEVGELKIGSLSAPKEVMHWHGIENYSSADKMANFRLNILRYTSDFIHLDGVRSSEIGRRIDKKFRKPFDKIFRKLSLEQDRFWVVYPFRFEQYGIVFYKERPFWSFIGFGLVLPAIAILLFSFLRKRRQKSFEEKMQIAFLVFGILHFLSLCYSAPYDPIKARYFMNMAIWFLPLVVYLFKQKVKAYIALMSFLVVMAGISTLLFRDIVPLTGKQTIATMSRTEQLLRSRPNLALAYHKFEELVPQNAIVALGTQQEHEDYEYPLWGATFERKLIPLHPFRSAVKPIPAEAEYLFYSEGVFAYQEGDIRLNTPPKNVIDPVTESTFFLRKLK